MKDCLGMTEKAREERSTHRACVSCLSLCISCPGWIISLVFLRVHLLEHPDCSQPSLRSGAHLGCIRICLKMHVSTLALWKRYFCLVKSILWPCRGKLKGWNDGRERVGRSQLGRSLSVRRSWGGVSVQGRKEGNSYRLCAGFVTGTGTDSLLWQSGVQIPCDLPYAAVCQRAKTVSACPESHLTSAVLLSSWASGPLLTDCINNQWHYPGEHRELSEIR